MSEAAKEIIFAVEEAPEGGYVARALGHDIFTEADTLDALRDAVRDAARCHFGEANRPEVIRLHVIMRMTANEPKPRDCPFAHFDEWASKADTKGYGSFRALVASAARRSPR